MRIDSATTANNSAQRIDERMVIGEAMNPKKTMGCVNALQIEKKNIFSRKVIFLDLKKGT